MVMWVGPAVVSSAAIREAELGRQPTTDECLEALIHGRQGDAWKITANVKEHLIGRRVGNNTRKKPVHGSTLLGEPLAAGLESRAQLLIPAVFAYGHVH